MSHAIDRFLTALLFVATIFSARILSAAPLSESQNKHDTVLFVASFPRTWERSLYRTLQDEAPHFESLKGIRFEYIETLADADVAAKALSGIDPTRVLASIHMGDLSTSLTANLVSRPEIVLVSSDAYAPETLVSGNASSPRLRIGILPSFEHCRPILARLQPTPRKAALVYSPDSKTDTSCAMSFQSTAPPPFSSESGSILCPISPAGCQNQNDMAAAFQQHLSSLAKGDILILLPGQNTVKFAYMFQNFAEERGVGLVGLGESAISPALLTIDYAPAEIARYCLSCINQLQTSNVLRPPKNETLSPRAFLDSKIASTLGYSLATSHSDKGTPVKPTR